ncbi:MAG: hypothetical protein QY322_04045 [bacterium]|nr:MAG: hypothetical protein QY322_04045 [bacterium]
MFSRKNKIQTKEVKKMKKIHVFLAILTIVILSTSVVGIVAAAGQETCPNGGGWTKVDSSDLSQYPVSGATDYCFKAGSDNSRGCTGGLFDSWPQPAGTCGLSHWSYYIPPEEPVCENGADDYPTCTPPEEPVCENGADDYPTCTPPEEPVFCTVKGLEFLDANDPACRWVPREPKTCANCGQGQTEVVEAGQLVFFHGNTKDCFSDCDRFIVAVALQSFGLKVDETPLEDITGATKTNTDEGTVYVFPAEYYGKLQIETQTEFSEFVHYSVCSVSVGSWAVKDGSIITVPGMTATDMSVYFWEQGYFGNFLDSYDYTVANWYAGRVGTYSVRIP